MAADERRLGVPVAYAVGLAFVGVLALLFVLTYSGIVPIDNVYFFFFGNTALAVLGMALSALGGAFLGMLFSHRILAGRDITPLDRRMMEAIAELQSTVEGLERTENELLERLRELQDDDE